MEETIAGPHGPIGIDVRGNPQAPTVVYVHGFCGFKDWGAWNLVADWFADKGFCFVKVNLSHNGTTPDHPCDFADLDAFRDDTFSIQLDDVGAVIDHLDRDVFLMGHSLGGGVVMLKAAEDERVKKVVTLAGVASLGRKWTEPLRDQWKEEGVLYYENGRTKQKMPMSYARVDDYLEHRERLDLEVCVPKVDVPILLVHAADDPVVPVENSERLQELASHAELLLIKEGGHTFGAIHPWEGNKMPPPLARICGPIAEFLLGTGPQIA